MSNDNKALVYNALKAQGWNDIQISGMMSAIEHESNFNPRAFNPNDPGGSVGLNQWLGGRKQALYDFTGTQNPSIPQQVDFLNHELNTNEKAAGDALRAAKTPGEAAQAMVQFERFKGYDNPNNPERLARIKTAYGYAGQQYEPMTPEQIAAAGGQTGTAPIQPANGQGGGHAPANQPPPGILAMLTGKAPPPTAKQVGGGILSALSSLGDSAVAAPTPPPMPQQPTNSPQLAEYVNQYGQSVFKKTPFDNPFAYKNGFA
jgi:hypothetical protein